MGLVSAEGSNLLRDSARLGRAPVRLGEWFFGICALLYCSTAFIRLLMGESEFAAIGDEVLASPVKRILWPITYLSAAYFFFKYERSGLKILRRVTLLVLLLGYIAVSILWSGSRAISIVSVGALLGNSLVGLYFGVRYGLREFLRLLGWVYGVIVVATFLARIAIGSQAIDGGFWVGFFGQKNALGANAVIGFLVFFMLAKMAPERRGLFRAFAALSALLVFLSGSTTCIVILFVLLFVMIWRGFVQRHAPSTLFQTLILLGLGLIALSQGGHILSALDSSENFMGRVGLWAILMSMVRDKLFLGYGYGGFWVFGGPAQTIWDALGVDPREALYAHNGYVQVLVDVGLAGVALLLALLFSAFQKAWAYGKATGDLWPLYFFGFMVLHNLTEGTFVQRNNFLWLLFVAILVQLTRFASIEARRTMQAATVISAHLNVSSSVT